MGFRDFLTVLKTNKKYKTVFIISIFVAVFILAGAVAAKRYSKPKQVATKTAVAKPIVADQLVTCALDGKSYKKELATRHPLAVIVENHPEARPQSGLSQASIVYEAITEGGITRNLAIFGPNDASEVGPIRSARLFFMDWLKEYDAFFAHAGGNEDALANIGAYGIKDIPHTNPYYWRDSKGRKVASEHTLYSSTQKLYELATKDGFDINTSSFDTLKFRPEKPVAGGKGVEIDFSHSASYKVKWEYRTTDNVYLRSLAGKQHVDLSNNEQIKAKNIIIQYVDRTLQPTGSYGSENWVFTTKGSGDAKILRDGEVIEATWKKASRDERTKFFDKAGVEIAFSPGSTWYEIASVGTTTVTEI